MEAIRIDLFIKQACRQVSEVSCVGKYKAHHLYPKNLPTSRLCGSQQTVGNSERDGNTRTPDLPRDICMQVRKQQLELDMEQQTGSKQEKEYVKAVHCHPVYLTYMQSTS